MPPKIFSKTAANRLSPSLFAVFLCSLWLLPDLHLYASDTPVYNPPETGAPTRRMGAGTRGAGDNFNFFVIAPEHTGHVMNAQPVLYWFSAKPVKNARFRLQQVSPARSAADLDIRVSASKAGIQAINLAAYKTSLQYDVIYEWSVTLPTLPGQGKTALTSATLKRVSPPAMLNQEIAKAKKGGALYVVYARSGFWYDAISNLSALIEARPEDTVLLTHRVVLMEQVSLPKLTQVY